MTILENLVSIYIGVCHKDNLRLLQNVLCRECQRDVEIVNRAKSEEGSDYVECCLFQK